MFISFSVTQVEAPFSLDLSFPVLSLFISAGHPGEQVLSDP